MDPFFNNSKHTADRMATTQCKEVRTTTRVPNERTDTAWCRLMNNPEHLNALVDGMAKTMANVLTLRHHEIDNGKTPLGKVLYDQKEQFPTRQQLDELEEVQHALAFVRSAEQLANSIRLDANNGKNTVLAPYASGASFKHCWNFWRPRGKKHSKLRVGGIAQQLYKDVVDQMYDWILDCDEAMCVAHGDRGDEHDDARALPSHVLNLFHKLARRMTRRVTLCPAPAGEENDDDGLSTSALQSYATVEMARTSLQATHWQQNDLAALTEFHTLATEGARSCRGRAVLENSLHLLQYVVRTPPVELRKGENAQRMNLVLLARACAPDVDIEVRCGIAQQWFAYHGACAATAARQAIQKLTLWKVDERNPFIRVLQPPPLDDKPSSVPAGIKMPSMPFVCSPHEWRFTSPQEGRKGLDYVARRVVRMTSMILQLLAHGAIERGVVASHMIVPTATHAWLEAKYVIDLLKLKRDKCSDGTSLLRFCEDVANYESDISSNVDDALLHVSYFSTFELMSIFHNQSPALRLIMDEFSNRTRTAMGNRGTPVVPAMYTAFAYDAMAILLPVIQHRRDMVGISVNQVRNPLAVLLNRIPTVKGWHPLKGTLRLTLEDLRAAGPLLLLALQELVGRKILVDYKRAYLGGQKRDAKKSFVFDTPQLVALLGGGG